MKKLTTSVFAVRNGSTYAVVGSGKSDMSDSWIAWKPRIDEQSKFSPLSKTSCPNDETGTVKCCMIPGRSQNRTSTISMPSSETYFSSSSLVANIHPPRGSPWLGDGATVGATSFSTVSRMFRRCNAPVGFGGAHARPAVRDGLVGTTHPGAARRLRRLLGRDAPDLRRRLVRQ